jgi:hypothetical protein
LTVADDLLKNDGKKFIEMMEQLAERRMAREEEANGANGTAPREANLHHQHVHNHAQPEYEDEEDYEEEDEDDDYDDEEEEDEEPVRILLEIFYSNYTLTCIEGYYDGGTAYGRRPSNVPNLCSKDV